MPITIELPDLASQTKFNLARWTANLADPELTKLPYRIETDQHGYLFMSPPLAPLHGQRQVDVALLLRRLLPNGRTLSECPVSTAGGVKAVDVAWPASDRPENIRELTLFERAPEICVEILSPSNSASEIDERRALYFGARCVVLYQTCSARIPLTPIEDNSEEQYVAPVAQECCPVVDEVRQ